MLLTLIDYHLQNAIVWPIDSHQLMYGSILFGRNSFTEEEMNKAD